MFFDDRKKSYNQPKNLPFGLNLLFISPNQVGWLHKADDQCTVCGFFLHTVELIHQIFAPKIDGIAFFSAKWL